MRSEVGLTGAGLGSFVLLEEDEDFFLGLTTAAVVGAGAAAAGREVGGGRVTPSRGSRVVRSTSAEE